MDDWRLGRTFPLLHHSNTPVMRISFRRMFECLSKRFIYVHLEESGRAEKLGRGV